MKIYSMTATFGKLEHETLTLQPGLNIIQAPNEWGKSTWCAFLVTMLYGLDTRAKTTKAALADKERYAPWSGSPMSGRIDLEWNGRDITIERSSKGRTPMGIFRAYETATGVEIPELTAANCGQTLLGVERSVFTRAGFLRFSDLPVTQDDALRHRLNALVTTGDESGAAEALGQKLRDLKNRCRYNRSGLLPQAESQRAQLEGKLREIDDLTIQAERLRKRHSEVEQWIAQLENHKTALQYAAAKNDEQRVQAAAAAHTAALEQYQLLENRYLTTESKKKFSVSMLHYSFAVKAFVELVKQVGMEEYEFAIHETKTSQVIENVKNMKSELGILYLSDFNQAVLSKLFKENGLVFEELFICDTYVYLWKGHPLATRPKISIEELEDYPCIAFEQGKNNSFHFAEEMKSTFEYKKLIKIDDRATVLNLMVGLNAYTLCSGIICEELNGSDYVAIPLKESEKMRIGYIKHKGAKLSPIGEIYLNELKKYLISI